MPSLREAPLCDIPPPARPADIPFSLAAPPPTLPLGSCAEARLTPASNAAVVTRNLLLILFVIYSS
jgi:hypothetical protein